MTGIAAAASFRQTVSGDFFSVVGTKPILGRGFTRDEEKPGTRVTVLSHELWQNAFHGDANIIGRADHAGQAELHRSGSDAGRVRFSAWMLSPSCGEPLPRKLKLQTQRILRLQRHQSNGALIFCKWSRRLEAGCTMERAREEMNVIAQSGAPVS